MCLSGFNRFLSTRMDKLIGGFNTTAVSTGNVSQREKKTWKSIYTSAVVARLDILCLRGAQRHIVSVSRQAAFFLINYRAGALYILTSS